VPVEQALRRATSPIGSFEWTKDDTGRVANFWSLPLKFAFAHPHFTLVLSESRAEALGLLARFRNDFLLVMLVSLSVVILLSLNQIRKNLVPLEKIREGTRRIAMQDFTARVEVSSGDEFEEVARSFNVMAGWLARQFRALAAMNEIDRSILSVLDAEKIVQTVLTRVRELLPCDSVGVTLRESKTTDRATMHLWGGRSERDVESRQVLLTDQEVDTLSKQSD